MLISVKFVGLIEKPMNLRILIDSIADNLGQPFNEVLKERLKFSIISSRAILLRREYDKSHILPESAILEIRCIDIIDVDSAECCDGSTKSGCMIRRTETKIPSILYFKDQVSASIKFVGSADKKADFDDKPTFQYIMPEQIQYISAGKFTKKLPFFTFINGYLYFLNTKAKTFLIRAAWANPLELLTFCGAQDIDCLFDEDNVNIEDHLVDIIKDLTYKELGVNKTATNEIQINE